MAGTLTISTLSDGTNSTSSTNCIKGSARVWVCFTGSTAVVRGSYNTSSVTRNGTGDYTINYTNALPDTNYALAGMADPTATYSAAIVSMQYQTALATTSCRIVTKADSGTGFDSPTVMVNVHSN
jgi:hypothetical protein